MKAIVLFLCVMALAASHHVVFEDVGEIATSITYIHVAIPLNLTGIRKLAHHFGNAITLTTDPRMHFHKNIGDDHYKRTYWDDNYIRLLERERTGLKRMFKFLGARKDRVLKKVEHLTKIMPLSGTAPSNTVSDFHFRIRRFASLPLFIAKGIFGTFMGLYNRRQQARLKEEMRSTLAEQRRLIQLLRVRHEETMDPIERRLQGIAYELRSYDLASGYTLLTQVLNFENEITDELDRITAAVQQAQLRRLSPLLLSAEQLSKLMEELKLRSAASRSDLLIEQISDLFQIEVSYLFDGEDITLLLHVPTVRKEARLRLMKFLPFPLSFSDSHFLLPRPANNLLAISSSEPRLSLDLTEADLEGCYRIGNVHLCERLGVLRNGLSNTCLGALYAQKFEQSMSACTMDVVPVSERILQLRDNWFLIYATSAFTAYVSCLNSTSSEFHLKMGVNRIPLSPTCQLKLKDHVLFADTALRVESQIREFAWNLEDEAFSKSEVDEATDVLEQISAEGDNQPSLADVRRHSAQSKSHPKWLYFFILLGILIFFGLISWLSFFIFTHKWFILRRTIRLITNRIWPPNTDPALYHNADDSPPAPPPAPPPPPVLPPPRPQVVARRSQSQPADLPAVFARTRRQLLSGF